MKKERKDIRELEGAYEYVENYVTDNLKRNYSYNGIVPENLLKQVQGELDFIKETKIAFVFSYASHLIRFSEQKGFFGDDNIYEKVSIKVNVDTKWVASLMNITDVYMLPLHYHCWRCGFSDFENVENVTTGKELPKRLCPNCEYELDGWGSTPTPQKQIEITDVMNDAIIEMTFPIAKRHEVLDLANHLVGKENRNYSGVKLYFK